MGKLFLSPPHMSAAARDYLIAAFDSNWIAPVGPDLESFEREFASYLGVRHAIAVSSGTAALHLALRLAGVGPNDVVPVSTLTFVAPANAIRYTGASPLMIDSEWQSWNMDPGLLSDALEALVKDGVSPKAVVVVDVLGQCADYGPIQDICNDFGALLIEDAAEALGATYGNRHAGTLGDIGCFSFNGNKMITTSGGGMLVTNNSRWAEKARHLATQARDRGPHYEHSEVGHNYRMSNLLAAIGRGQLEVLEQRVARRREIYSEYRGKVGHLHGIEFIPEASFGRSSCWLTCILINPERFGATRDDVRLMLEAENIESRPCWKPMHLQPLFADQKCVGGAVAEKIFETGLCLPSGSQMSEQDVHRVASLIRSMAACKMV